MQKITSDTLKQINRLPADQRQRVEAVVRRHVQACFGLGFAPDDLERVYVEAIQQVEMGDDLVEAEHGPTELFRRYEQYTSPREENARRIPPPTVAI